jgi:hypothetical protein
VLQGIQPFSKLTYYIRRIFSFQRYYIFHIAYVSTGNRRKIGLVLGAIAFIISIAAAVIFVTMMNEQASKIGKYPFGN